MRLGAEPVPPASIPASPPAPSRPAPQKIDPSDPFSVYTGFLDAVIRGDRKGAFSRLSGDLLESGFFGGFDFAQPHAKHSYDPHSVRNLGRTKIHDPDKILFPQS